MSLQHLGIAHFPVLHRQFSSPAIKTPLEASPSQDLTQDNKDVLVDRLNDLVLRLSNDNSLGDITVTAIHSEVDRIELLLRDRELSQPPPQVLSPSFSSFRDDGEDIFWGPRSPSQSIRMRLPEISDASKPRSIQYGSQMGRSRATELAAAAEDLSSHLTATIAELQIRKEESDHIHDLLVTRAEKAAERILLLENHIAETEEEFDAVQSELKFLRIQLQAIEAQSLQYIPPDEDRELTESIMNWKIDWENIDRRSKARSRKSNMSLALLEKSPLVHDGS